MSPSKNALQSSISDSIVVGFVTTAVNRLVMMKADEEYYAHWYVFDDCSPYVGYGAVVHP